MIFKIIHLFLFLLEFKFILLRINHIIIFIDIFYIIKLIFTL